MSPDTSIKMITGKVAVKTWSVLTILAVVIVWAASSRGDDSHSLRLEIAGSSTIQPLAEVVGGLYTEKYHRTLRIKGGGTGAGIESVLSGMADIGLVSRALRDEEKKKLDYATIGYDAVVVIVNSANPLSEIRSDVLAALYNGAVPNWKEIGGRDEPVLLISKLPGRSTLEIFEEYAGLRHASRLEKGIRGTISISAFEIGSNLESATLVGGLPGAVGYVSMGSALSLIGKGMPLKILSLEGVEGTRENVMNGRYPVMRELNLVFKRENRRVKQFIEFFLGPEGQSAVKKNGFIPANGARQARGIIGKK
jgi:phosphate transport system substrate-binding protein